MFTVTEYKLAKRHCANELGQLLALIGIADCANDEQNVSVFEKMDADIDAWLRTKMHVDSTFGVYVKLLQLGRQPLLASDTTRELVAKICEHATAIREGLLLGVDVQGHRPQTHETPARKKRHSLSVMSCVGLGLAGVTYLATALNKDISDDWVMVGAFAAVALVGVDVMNAIVGEEKTYKKPPVPMSETTTRTEDLPSAKELDEVLEALARVNKINQMM